MPRQPPSAPRSVTGRRRSPAARGTLLLAALLSWVACAAPPAPFELSPRTLDAWAMHLAPSRDELAWEQVGWLPSYEAGLRAAAARGRPLLLWMMNGHPLGCT